jgi:hypothetical protein
LIITARAGGAVLGDADRESRSAMCCRYSSIVSSTVDPAVAATRAAVAWRRASVCTRILPGLPRICGRRYSRPLNPLLSMPTIQHVRRARGSGEALLSLMKPMLSRLSASTRFRCSGEICRRT